MNVRDVADIRMGESVVPDCVAFVINPFCDAGKFVRLNADQEESCIRVLLFQDVKNPRCPLRIGAVIEGERNFIRRIAIAPDAVRLG